MAHKSDTMSSVPTLYLKVVVPLEKTFHGNFYCLWQKSPTPAILHASCKQNCFWFNQISSSVTGVKNTRGIQKVMQLI